MYKLALQGGSVDRVCLMMLMETYSKGGKCAHQAVYRLPMLNL